ncbi:MAG: hypothetical protein IKM97_03300 [Clostridia bacterium]|nr:hypothetical protein [Clostridia bacterium]
MKKFLNGDSVFRYYSNNEENLIKKISDLDEQINKALEENESIIVSSDMVSLERQIEDTLNTMYNTNEIRKLDEYLKKIESYISKKAQIAGERSPSGSLVKNLIQKRASFEAELNSSSRTIYSPISGIVSYRVDGFEDYFKIGDFSYLNKKTLDSYNLKTGNIISQNIEIGKVVNNFICYIATPINTEKSDTSKVGDIVTLRLANSKEVEAEISDIVNDINCKILVFKIKDKIEELIDYRKISFDIIWWKYSGFKISNSAISTLENDVSYIERSKAGYTEKIFVKILRQNDTYSIVQNYSDEELEKLGFSSEEISDRVQLKLHDEIILH